MYKLITKREAKQLLVCPSHISKADWTQRRRDALKEGAFRIGPNVYDIRPNWFKRQWLRVRGIIMCRLY